MTDNGLFVRISEPVDLLICEVQVLDPRSGIDGCHDVLIRQGKIAEIGAPGTIDNKSLEYEKISGKGLHLLPAFVDPHVHLREPGQSHKETIGTGTRAAAHGGFCTVIGMPNTDPVVDSVETLASLKESALEQAIVPVGFMASVTRGLKGSQLTDMVVLRSMGALGFTDDGLPVADAGVLRRALRYQRLCGGVIALHEEDHSLSAGGSINDGWVAAKLGIGGIPSISESAMVARDVAIAEYEQARIQVQHLSCAESVAAVAAAKDRGVQVTAEATPHHLILTEESTLSLNTSFKMNPPLRTETDRQALIEGLRSGVIDCVATDHAPHHVDEKQVPFEEAMMGTTGLETAFPALYTELVRPGHIDLGLLVERMTAGGVPFGIPAPTITVGTTANLCLIDLKAQFKVGEHGYASRSTNCCFDGRMLYGEVLVTVAAGQLACCEKTFDDDSWKL